MENPPVLPVGHVIRCALSEINRHWRFFLPLTALYLLLSVALEYGAVWISMNRWFSGISGFFFLQLLYQLVGLVFTVKFAIAVHRAVLLRQFTWSAVFRFEGRDGLYIGVTIVLYVGLTLLILLSGFVLTQLQALEDMKPVFKLTAMVLFVYVVSRVSLVFPAIAVDRFMSLHAAWKRTWGYGLQLFGLLGVLPVLIGHAIERTPDDVLGWVITWSLVGTLCVFEVALLSHSYRVLVIEHPRPEDAHAHDGAATQNRPDE